MTKKKRNDQNDESDDALQKFLPSLSVVPSAPPEEEFSHHQQTVTYTSTIEQNQIQNSTTYRAMMPTRNEKIAFKQRLTEMYPKCFVTIISLVIIIINISMVITEVSTHYENLRDNDDEDIFAKIWSYASSFLIIKLMFWSSAFNLFYSSIALLTVMCRNYFIVQLFIIFHLSGGISTFVINCLGHIGLLVNEIEEQGDNIKEKFLIFIAINILLSLISSIFSIIFFIKMQFRFLKNLNNNTKVN
jgi:hypothetical protein